MASSPGPFYVRINYHSALAPHTMTIPINTWNDVVSTNPHGQIDNFNGSSVDAQDMIEGLVTVLLPEFPVSVTFDNWIIFHKPDVDGPSFPLTGESFTAMVGSNTSGSWGGATQLTYTWRTTDFGIFKLVLLDSAFSASLAKITDVTNVRVADITAIVTDVDLGWSGRDNTQPENFVSLTQTLNEKLRRAYRYA